MKSSKRKIVVEHSIIGRDGNKYPTIILDGNLWGDDFEEFLDDELYHDEGTSPVDGKPVEYKQSFILTDKTNEEILAAYDR